MSAEPLPYVLSAAALGAAALVTFGLAYKLRRAGAWAPVTINNQLSIGPLLLLYTEQQGPYKRALADLERVKSLVVEGGMLHRADKAQQTTLGFYYDDPRTTPAGRCRYATGWVFKLGSQVARPADMETHKQFLEGLTVVKTGELKVGVLPEMKCVGARVPFDGALSVMFALWRVYPHLQAAVKALPKAQQQHVQGSLELYVPSQRSMLVAFPYTPGPAPGSPHPSMRPMEPRKDS